MKCDVCGATLISERATARKPYPYVECGLPNVYLIGIELRSCPQHGESPVIPRMGELHCVIALSLIEKPGPLLGGEVTYLRKFARMQAKDFAARLRVSPETLSRIENSVQKMGASLDKLVRAVASAARDMKEARDVLLSPVAYEGSTRERVTLRPTTRGWREAA